MQAVPGSGCRRPLAAHRDHDPTTTLARGTSKMRHRSAVAGIRGHPPGLDRCGPDRKRARRLRMRLEPSPGPEIEGAVAEITAIAATSMRSCVLARLQSGTVPLAGELAGP